MVGQMVTHCENFRRFAIIDAPDQKDDTKLLDWRNMTLSSTYAAVYAPHLQIVNHRPGLHRAIHDRAAVGVRRRRLRPDRPGARGPQGPGNERVTGIVGLRQTYTQRRQDLLNPGSVNLIRAFPGAARGSGAPVTPPTTAPGATSTCAGCSTSSRPPSSAAPSGWCSSRTPRRPGSGSRSRWRTSSTSCGAPARSRAPPPSRRTGCGSASAETMTETDIDLGLVITEVAIAPAKPAEFVVFRFSHKRLSE